MVRKPAAFLMDEPLSNLDASLRVHMRSELAELHRSLGTTFIYVTHDQAEALTMSDRMAVMMDGEILQIGPPDEVYQEPQDIRVAEFIGSPKINILPGSGDASGSVQCLGVRFARQLRTPVDGNISIGIRPEHFDLRPKKSSGSFEGKLVHIENLGSDVFLHIVLNDGAHRVVARAKPHEVHDASVGDTVWIARQPGKAMAFGVDGRRLPLKSRQKPRKAA
jgi:multiple sugar transport system ATP-binding protein